MKIKSVKPIGKHPTMDLEVNHPLHQFYCNGLLTSNSHAVSYTLTSYREYWLKTYYPAEFNVALLNNTDVMKEKKKESVMAQYITEIRHKGFNIVSPSINESIRTFTIDSKDNIVWALEAIKNNSDAAIDALVEEREKNGKYTSIEDLFDRLPGRIINKRVIEALIWSGALDEFLTKDIPNRCKLHEYVFINIRKEKKYEPFPYSVKFIIDQEVEYCKLSLTESDKFSIVRKFVENKWRVRLNPLYEVNDAGDNYKVVGKIVKVEHRKTKTNKDYVRISLQDETFYYRNIYVWPWKCSDIDEIKNGLLIFGTLNNRDGFTDLVDFIRIGDNIL